MVDATPEIGTGRPPRRVIVPVVFTGTIFLSAALLFLVQPLFAKQVLPLLGGAPAVWTTAMLFFQSVLVAGYLYAHLMIRHVPARLQLPIHLAFWAVALAFLPLGVPAGIVQPDGPLPLQTLAVFAVGVGVPFAVLSANAPLIQAWYARTDGPSAGDPYFLYAASNTGSLLALLAFPLVAEPLFGAAATNVAWAGGFVLLGAGLLASGGFAWTRRAETQPPAPQGAATVPPIGFARIARWTALAFVPSSTMLFVTTKVSTDLGALPLIWVAPLSLYILSFVIVFVARPVLSDRAIDGLFLTALAILAVTATRLTKGGVTVIDVALMCLAVFFVALKGHRALYLARPDAGGLTLFYLVMSIGGALGGLFNSIVAPLAFDTMMEGPITLMAAGLLGVAAAPRDRLLRGAALGLLLGGVLLIALRTAPLPDQALKLTAIGLAAGALLAWGRRWTALPPAMMVVMAGALPVIQAGEPIIRADRSFFGVHSVKDRSRGAREYANGTTIHGIQVLDPAERLIPRAYFVPNGPMAQMLTDDLVPPQAQIGVVGLGIGALACYREKGQDWHFYEIDPKVIEIARDPSLFTFMSDCAPEVPVHLGDARIILDRQSLAFDVLVIDAYSSDAVPIHLLTVEAMGIYLDRLAPKGRLVMHISNRYYDLVQPIARLARAHGVSLVENVRPWTGDRIAEAEPSRVVVLTRDAATIETLAARPMWQRVTPDDGRPWTDDRSNLLQALR